MTRGEFLNILTESAKRYRKDANKSICRNNHMNEIADDEKIPQRIIDALLVDFINYVGAEQCVDYALYTRDLH